ncbi:MAG: roadblock/LC7 domain-containing protein [Promethearchaeota archaeon]
MSKEELEPKLAKLMDSIPECEGVIAADKEGKVIIAGQTIVEMDHSKIATACAKIIQDSNELGKNIGKGSLVTNTIELENGFAILVGSAKTILIGLTGLDGKASLALLRRNLVSILK